MEEKIYKEIVGIKKELKFIKQYIFIPTSESQNEMTEDELLDIAKQGEAEYKAGKTEDFATFLKREDPESFKVFNAKIRSDGKIQKKSLKVA